MNRDTYVLGDHAHTGTVEPLVTFVAVEHELPIVVSSVADACNAVVFVLLENNGKVRLLWEVRLSYR